jgi:hypothetical protein
MPFMNPEDRAALRQEVRARREPRVLFEGKFVPGSVRYLRDLMASAEDEYERDVLLVEVGAEYLRAEMEDEHLQVQRERVRNHPDAAVMWLSLADALSWRPDGAQEANDATARAVEISRTVGALLRYSLSCQARVARATGNREVFERAISDLLEDAPNYRKEDSGFFGNFIESLPAGFCSSALLDAYRKLLAENDI